LVSAMIVGDGTTETTWLPWLEAQPWPTLDLSAAAARRVVVLAAHPDDEVLGAAGLMVTLASRGHALVVVWATDGEASHPGSTAMSSEDLRTVRREECHLALGRLGVTPVSTHHLGLPDGRVNECRQALREALTQIVDPHDLVIAPWRDDGHPDHEAVGEVADRLGARTWQYPIWMWHWAAPGDDRVPWDRCRVAGIPDVVAKAAAISMFASQVQPIGPSAADAAILPPHVVSRFLRRHEWIIT
jgi:LmbE family N-acetylglucosaminyl deacetylase